MFGNGLSRPRHLRKEKRAHHDHALLRRRAMNNATITPITIATGTSFDLAGNLAAFSALATNGIDDAMHIGIFVDGGTGHNANATESSLGIGPPIFAGQTLTRINILGTGFQPTGGLDGTEFRTTTEYRFYTNDVSAAPVPLPAAAPMGLACFALFATYRRLRTFGSRVLGG
jgi:hypothetical protein